jgi:hypothetical protein
MNRAQMPEISFEMIHVLVEEPGPRRIEFVPAERPALS